MIEDSQAWAQYWRETAVTGGACAPNSPGIAAETARLWREHGTRLPRRAAVLDLATGNGTVLQQLRRVQPGLTLVGVDSAPDLGQPLKSSLRLMPGVAMEHLPFDEASFDTVTSQFGFEYGATEIVAREIMRVLRPGGNLRLLMHHSNSPVVLQGYARRIDLRWALAPGSALEQAANFAAARRLAPMPIPPALRAAPAEAASRFQGSSAAAEIMTAMLQMLELAGADAPVQLRNLRNKAESELARLDALIRAARDRAMISAIVQELELAGLSMDDPKLVREPSHKLVFAWLLDGKKT